ncbi:DUF21-domain-containing protein [Choiromyces venosus 120613-1]|uniref:DUF21-domain-containing protein n=1 Tax=Choiromyces venosus 120613-1 TaxID=1336337 RepID=A0A3N4JIB6_9PEZI|nr:DUF21-domain-containing protein [Choiromyces venosus 120613-1]
MAIPTRSPLAGLARVALLLTTSLPRLHSYPVYKLEEGDPESSEFWVNVGIAFFLVVLGGIFAGLTLGLMGQDEIYLQVIEQSGEGAEKKHATKVLRLLKRGKHWVLVTLLLSNVITNETLPIVLDRSLGGGWPAVLSSTVLIVIFGEIIPQSVCVRYGLSIGAYLSPFVIGLMYLMYPVAYPTALLLDYILGEDHGTVYKKAGLKTLVTLHKNLGPSPSERLNEDEVTIISAVLDLKDKPVGSIMTPIKDVFIMSSDTVLDEETMNRILSAGYSRIPIHAPGELTNFVGMLLVKILITYDPEDAKRVGEFPLATLPETREETSCLDIVNFFQEGKSHMVLVSDSPGENHGALGVVTLEDVIEELIGEEIIDESDVFIDVHKAIRRIHPSPLSRRSISTHFPRLNEVTVASTANIAASVVAPESITHPIDPNDKQPEDLLVHDGDLRSTDSTPHNDNDPNLPRPPSAIRRSSQQASLAGIPENVLPHLKCLGPANLAGNPKSTKYKAVKIKPAGNQDEHVRVPVSTGEGIGQVMQVHESRAGSPATILPGDENSQLDGNNVLANPFAITFDPALLLKKPNSREDGGDEEDEAHLRTIRKRIARSGSLVERVERVGGVHKTVIETTSSGDESGNGSESSGKKDKKDGGSGRKGGDGETRPLLGGWGVQ